MKLAAIVLGLMLAGAARAQTYLVQPDVPTAQTRSAALWQQVQCQPQPTCDAAQITKRLLQVQPLIDGTATLVVPAGANLAALATNQVTAGVAALTPAEQAAVTPLTNDTRLPWLVAFAAFEARLTAVNPTAITSLTGANAVSALGLAWTAIKATAVTNLQSTQVATLMAAMETAGIITRQQAAVIITPVAVAVVPQ